MRQRLLARLADATYSHPWFFVLGGILLAVASLALTQARLGFETSRNALISPDKEYLHIYNAYRSEFGQRDELVIVIDEPDLRRSKAFARDLAARLEADPAAARKVFYRIDPDALGGRALMYLSPTNLADLQRKLTDHLDLINGIAAEPTLTKLLRSINREISEAMVGHLVSSLLGIEDDKKANGGAMDLSLLQGLIDAIGAASRNDSTGSVWRGALRPGKAMAEDGYLVDDDKRMLFVLVQTPEDSTKLVSSAAALERVREHVAATLAEHPGLRVGITGGPALETEEMQATVADMRIASVLSLVGVGLCFVLFYREVARPLLAVFTLTLGLAWSFGFITLAIGHLTILSVAFATILIGMSDDFGVHLISRFEEEMGEGLSVQESLRRTFIHSGGGIIAGAVTFAVAFLTMTLTDFRGMAELGLIGGVGILLCLAGMLTVFPSLLVLYERFKSSPIGQRLTTSRRTRGPGLAWAGGGVFDRLHRWPLLLLAISGLVTAASLLALPRLGFDLNLLHLQAEGTDAVAWEHRILSSGSRSSRYAVSVADSLEAARRLQQAYEQLPEVRRVESAASIVPDDQPARMQAIEGLAPLIDGLPEVGAPDGEVDVQQLHELLQSVRFKLQDPKKRWDPDRKPSDEDLERVRTSLAQVEPRLGESDAKDLRPALLQLQTNTFADLSDEMGFLRRNTRAGPITLDGLPEVLRDRFVSRGGKFLVQVFPAEDIWDPDNLEVFVTALRKVDPNVTGPPVAFHETSRLMRDGYIQAGLYALFAICVLVLWDFRKLGPTVLALAPLAIGAIWTVGVMGLLDLQLNLANLIILPLIIGIGVSNGIHILHRHIEEGGEGGSVMSRSTGKAVILSSLTTALGFGALTVAHHQGIHSLGLLLTIGVLCNLLAAILVLPALLALLPRRNPQARPPSAQTEPQPSGSGQSRANSMQTAP